jgi:hypothetical protein
LPASSSRLLNVNPTSLNITAINQSKLYGESLTFNGSEFSASGLVNGDTIGTVSLSSSGAASVAGVGSYPINVSNATGGTFSTSDYNISYNSGILTINPTTLNVTAINQSKLYGESLTFNGSEFSASGLVNGDTIGTVSLSSSGAASVAGVGSYPINVSNATGGTFSTSDYNISYNSGILTINPTTLNVTAINQSKLYGESLTFNGSEFSASGLVNGDTIGTVSLSSSGAASVAGVGSYPINVSNATGGTFSTSDYNISYNPGILTINPTTLNVTAINQSKLYGESLTFNGSEFSASGLVNGDTIGTVSLSSSGAASVAGVGSYPINVSNATGGTFSTSDYNISYNPGILTVKPGVKETFAWELFLPAIQGGHECSLDFTGLCKNKENCEAVGAYWWKNACHTNMSKSQALMAKIAGDIHFTYNMFGVNWNEFYHFDINTLEEISNQGFFQIWGIDDYGNVVRAYDHGYNLFGAEMYIFTNYGFATVDERFIFQWNSSSTLTGTIKVKDKSTASFEDGVHSDLTGYHTP